jgi:hypothetical protein
MATADAGTNIGVRCRRHRERREAIAAAASKVAVRVVMCCSFVC